MGKGADAPNVIGAARETGEQAMRLNESQTTANRPNQYNAWGSTEWGQTPVWNPVTGQYVNTWTQTERLNPTLQSAVDSQQAVTAGRSNLAEGMMARVWDDYSRPMNFDQFGKPIQMQQMAGPQQFNYDPNQTTPNQFNFGQPVDRFNADPNGWRQKAEDAAYGRATSRLDPQFQRQEQDLLTRLRNQGLKAGDQAYDAAVQNFQSGRNDAYEQARMGSTLEGRAEADQFFGQQLGGYQANLGAQGQGFQQALAGSQFNAGLGNQQFQQGLAAHQANLGAQGQGFNQSVQQNQIANALRSQEMQEALSKRGYNLAEVERLLAGQGISGGPPSTGGDTQTLVGNLLQGKT